MSTSTKIQIAVGVVVLILAIVGVIFGVVTHQEPGLMKVCWSSTMGTARYDCEGASAEDLIWPRERMPLTVSTDGLIGETQTAIDLINSQVGCELLAYAAYDDTPNDIIITAEGAMDQSTSRGGATWHLMDDDRMRARVELYAPGDLAQRVIVHELGHALGLAHDPYPASIMYPTQRNATELQFIRISDNDRALLRNLYCR